MSQETVRLPVAMRAYDMIESKAGSNVFIQGLTGVVGFPLTLAADVGALPLIYGRLWDEIRALYGQPPVGSGEVSKILVQLAPEVLADLAFDKVMGNVPLLGIYFNAICAKAMTWRLGMLFAVLASRGPELPPERIRDALRLVRDLFPQKDMFSFSTPERQRFLDLVTAVDGVSLADFDRKIVSALSALKS